VEYEVDFDDEEEELEGETELEGEIRSISQKTKLSYVSQDFDLENDMESTNGDECGSSLCDVESIISSLKDVMSDDEGTVRNVSGKTLFDELESAEFASIESASIESCSPVLSYTQSKKSLKMSSGAVDIRLSSFAEEAGAGAEGTEATKVKGFGEGMLMSTPSTASTCVDSTGSFDAASTC
jgi:hypothetical protein